MATPTGTGWGAIVAVGIFDAHTAGNCLYVVTFTNPITVGVGVIVKWKGSTSIGGGAPGNLSIAEA
jgi:hypothetical protein